MTAEDARRKVHGWLFDQVSYMMGAEAPELVLYDAHVVWRVPAVLTDCAVGRVGVVGEVDVDVETGEMHHLAECKERILRCAGEQVAKLSSHQPLRNLPDGYSVTTLPPTRSPGRPEGNPMDLLPVDARSIPV